MASLAQKEKALRDAVNSGKISQADYDRSMAIEKNKGTQAGRDTQNAYNQQMNSGGSGGSGGGGSITAPNVGYAPQYQQPQVNYQAEMQKLIEQQNQQQLQARLQALQAAKQTKISGIESQRGVIGQEYQEAGALLNQYKNQAAPQFQQQRSQAQIQTAQAANKLREIMAARGVLAGGENISANVGIQNQLQNTLGSIGQQEQDYMSDLDRRQADLDREKAQRLAALQEQIAAVNNAASAEELAVISDVGSQTSQALMDALNKSYDIQNNSLANYSTYLDNLTKLSNLEQNQQKQSLVNKWLSGEGLSEQERIYLGIDNMEVNNKDQYIQSIYAKLQAGQALTPTEQMVIGIYREPKQVAQPKPVSSKEQYIENIYKKLSSGQPLTAEERALIGLSNDMPDDDILKYLD